MFSLIYFTIRSFIINSPPPSVKVVKVVLDPSLPVGVVSKPTAMDGHWTPRRAMTRHQPKWPTTPSPQYIRKRSSPPFSTFTKGQRKGEACVNKIYARTHAHASTHARRKHARGQARIHTCTHARAHAHAHTRTRAYTHARMHALMHARARARAQTRTHTRTRTRTRRRTHLRTHARKRAHARTQTYIPTHTQRLCSSTGPNVAWPCFPSQVPRMS